MRYITILFLIGIWGCQEKEEMRLLSAPENLKIGDFYNGGIVFYILQEEDDSYIEGEIHGFVMGDTLSPVLWGCLPYKYTEELYDESVGGGEINTQILAEICPESVAAKIHEEGWYIPNFREIRLLGRQKDLLGLNSTDYYWTSSMKYDVRVYRFRDGKSIYPPGSVNKQYKIVMIKKF